MCYMYTIRKMLHVLHVHNTQDATCATCTHYARCYMYTLRKMLHVHITQDATCTHYARCCKYCSCAHYVWCYKLWTLLRLLGLWTCIITYGRENLQGTLGGVKRKWHFSLELAWTNSSDSGYSKRHCGTFFLELDDQDFLTSVDYVVFISTTVSVQFGEN